MSVAYVSLLRSLINENDAASTAYQELNKAGGTVYVVGGAVRDVVLGKRPKDIDLMVAGLTPEEIEATLAGHGRLDFTGKQFGVYRFKRGQTDVEIALPRTEQSTGVGHKDFSVLADPFLPVEDDLGRRDFTGNAMAVSLTDGVFIDPYGGMQHLDEGELHLVNDNAFNDDPLRIVRALVAVAVHGLQPTDELINSMRENAQGILDLPEERIQLELDKLLSGPDPAEAIALADESDILDYMIPELAQAFGFEQKNIYHDLDVGAHSLQVLNKMAELTYDPDLRLAALLHDIGKPDSFWQDESGHGHFYRDIVTEPDGTITERGEDHEAVGARLADAFMQRMRYPNARRERVVKLISKHMFPYFKTLKGARKFLAALDGDVKMAFDLFLLRESDAAGKKNGEINEYDTKQITTGRALLQEVIDRDSAFTKRDLAINGRDLITLGITEGPIIGQILERLLNVVVESPELNNREDLLGLADAIRLEII